MSQAVKIYLASPSICTVNSSSFTICPEHISHIVFAWHWKNLRCWLSSPGLKLSHLFLSSIADLLTRHDGAKRPRAGSGHRMHLAGTAVSQGQDFRPHYTSLETYSNDFQWLTLKGITAPRQPIPPHLGYPSVKTRSYCSITAEL